MGIAAYVGIRASPVKNRAQPVRIDPPAAVPHEKGDLMRPALHRKLDRLLAAGMISGVLQQIDDHLLDQRCVHRHYKDLLRHLHPHAGMGEPLFEAEHRLRHHFLQKLRSRGYLRVSHPDPGDRQQVLHHVQQPVGILLDAGHHLRLLLLRQGIGPVQISLGHTDDPGERRPQIVGHCPQQIRPHGLLLRFYQEFLLFIDQLALLFKPGSQGTGNDRHDQHTGECYRISVNG